MQSSACQKHCSTYHFICVAQFQLRHQLINYWNGQPWHNESHPPSPMVVFFSKAGSRPPSNRLYLSAVVTWYQNPVQSIETFSHNTPTSYSDTTQPTDKLNHDCVWLKMNVIKKAIHSETVQSSAHYTWLLQYDSEWNLSSLSWSTRCSTTWHN